MNTHLVTQALRPGSFIRLKDQPEDLPDFVLERYLDRFCWIRQQGWGRCVQWKVNVARIQTSSGEARLFGKAHQKAAPAAANLH